jgi:hypothetical protein
MDRLRAKVPSRKNSARSIRFGKRWWVKDDVDLVAPEAIVEELT